jgi:hypothetical protein
MKNVDKQSRREFLAKAIGAAAAVALSPVITLLTPQEVLAAGGGFTINLSDSKYADLSNPAKHFSMFINFPTKFRSYNQVQGGPQTLPFAFVVTKISDSPVTYAAVQGYCSHALYALTNAFDGTVITCPNPNQGHGSTFSALGKKVKPVTDLQTDLESYPTTYNAATNTITVTVAGLAVKDGVIVFSSPDLHQNYPNPVNDKTTISFELYSYTKVSLTVTDALGHIIALLADGEFSPGKYSFDFDGSLFPSGTYFYHLNAGGETQTKSMVIVR